MSGTTSGGQWAASTQSPDGWREAAAGSGACLVADAIFDGQRLHRGASLILAHGHVQSVSTPAASLPVWRVAGTVSPGFVDLQVNGGGGVLLNNDPTPAGLLAIARAHRGTGTAAILPTLITDAPEKMERTAEAILSVLGQEGIAGLHLEGPHLSPVRRGTHAAAHVRPLDGPTLGVVTRLRARGVPLMLTLAPEAVAPGQVASLVRQGVVVALGHSDAPFAQVRACLDEGAQTFTHLFNAMSQMSGREPGMVGAAIGSQAYASFIADGIHVAPEMLKIALRARPRPDRMILVTDAMPTVAGPAEFRLYNQTIRLRDGRLVNEEGALAGAHVTMLQSVCFAVEKLEVAPQDAMRMAITHPAELMGLGPLATIEGRRTSDILLVSPDWQEAEFLA